MPDGPGKYNDIATRIRSETQAKGIVLVVLGGNRGHGFELQFAMNDSPHGMYLMLKAQAGILKEVASDIETQATELRAHHGNAWEP
jgi:hypothetical protein